MIKVSDVHKSFGEVEVLRGISFELLASNQYVIRGASGSGKSTLLYLLGGLDKPCQGKITVGDKSLTDFNDEKLAQYRNQSVGFVFQFHFLLPSMNCLSNILLPAQIGGMNISQVKKEVLELAKTLGIDHCLKKYPFQLSGGEQQRINIIRALSLRPKLLLCDEPTGNLDSKNSKIVTGVLKELATACKSTLVIVTHDDRIAAQIPNEFVITDGKFY